ncbi:MAG: ABC transporter ATP-binding protein [Actinobacteria bacterium]|nr:ABC transporter ATP-binding protein [Actinomycetota bacterium]
MLSVTGLRVAYGGIHAVHAIDLHVDRGTVVALVGPNGAGKTSTIRGIGGQERADGRILFDGDDISGWPPHRVSRAGLAQVPQGRRLFPELTVMENLSLGAYKRDETGQLRDVFDLFPRLEERSNQRAGSMSGGEQQMLAIGRALMAGPKLIAMDEPSLGLAPILVRDVFDAIARIRELDVSVLLVEQNATQALNVSDHVYVLDRGRIVYEQPTERAREELDLIETYMG